MINVTESEVWAICQKVCEKEKIYDDIFKRLAKTLMEWVWRPIRNFEPQDQEIGDLSVVQERQEEEFQAERHAADFEAIK